MKPKPLALIGLVNVAFLATTSKFAYNGDGAVDAEIEAAKKHGVEIAAF
jgi:hypothetical protein